MNNSLEKKRFESQLTHENAALVILAHQSDMLFETESESIAEIRANFIALANAGRRFYLPAVVTTSDRSAYGDKLMKEMVELCPGIKSVHRPSPINAWQDSNFKAAIKNANRSKLIIAGMSMDICLSFTAISAAKDGYDVFVIEDAFENFNNKIPQATIDGVKTRMRETGCKFVKRVTAISQLQQAVKQAWEKKRNEEKAYVQLPQQMSSLQFS